jgi:hypothetical protein
LAIIFDLSQEERQVGYLQDSIIDLAAESISIPGVFSRTHSDHFLCSFLSKSSQQASIIVLTPRLDVVLIKTSPPLDLHNKPIL